MTGVVTLSLDLRSVIPPSSQRLLAAAAIELAEHERRNGAIPWRGGPGVRGQGVRRQGVRGQGVRGQGSLIAELEASGLTGRGGAGFPTWRKLASTSAEQRPIVIANAAEGEPASSKDAVLLQHGPHLVLDGLQLAAEAIGATEAYLYAKPGAAADSARRAVAQRTGWDQLTVQVVEAPKSFLAGEESAIIASLEGRPALPRPKLRLLTESGLRGRPTLVQNAETLAHIALLARHGADWFRQQGTQAEPGTFLATINGAVARPGVVEAGYGIALGDLLALAGGAAEPLGAVLIGGYHGAWLPAGASGVAVSRAGLAPWGASPGAGVVVALPARACALDATARIVAYLSRQSARQCGPCMFGLPAIADDLALLAAGGEADRPDPGGSPGGAVDPALPRRLASLVEIVDGRGACRHPDGTMRLVRSALNVFTDDVEAHLRGACLASPQAKGAVR